MTPELIVTNTADIDPKLVCGERISILADASQTGSYEIYLHDAPEGAGPPPHSHPWDEAFYVIDGVVDFSVGEQRFSITAGGFVHVPRGTIHAFRYASATAKILGVTSNGGAANMFTAVDSECGPTPKVEQLVSILARNQVTVAV